MTPLTEGTVVQCNVAPATPREIEPGGLQALEEGVAPRMRVQRKKPASDLKEIQESPLFSGGEG
jgi:hypothetical protein